MAGVKDITPDLDRLDSQLDNLEDALRPLFKNMDGISSQLPLLDKAKFFSLTAYSIESLLFSLLKLQGTDVQNHAVYTELKRIQQYFGKIKAIEEPEASRTVTVNQEATARILKADLADNKSISSKLAIKIAEERAKALLKSVEQGKKRSADDVPSTGSVDERKDAKKSKHKHKSKSKSKSAR